MNHKKELVRGLWVRLHPDDGTPPVAPWSCWGFSNLNKDGGGRAATRKLQYFGAHHLGCACFGVPLVLSGMECGA